MMRGRVTHIIVLLITGAVFFAMDMPVLGDVAVIPYRVESSSASVSEETGIEYALLSGMAARISRGMDIYSPDMLARDMKSLSINPREVIDRDQLKLLGKTRYIDYIQTGTIIATGNTYRVQSLLYSVKRDTVVVRSEEEAATLFDLAEKEIDALYFQFSEQKRQDTPGSVDLVVLMDNSYNTAHEMDDARKGISEMADAVSINWASDTRIFVVPLVGCRPPSCTVEAATAPYSLKKNLEKLDSQKGSSLQGVKQWLSYLSRSFSWRKGSAKAACLLINSPGVDYSSLQQYFYRLKKNDISVNIIAGGKLHLRNRRALQRIAASTGGLYLDVTYHQRMFDLKGNAIDVFMEGGRLLHGQVPGDRWKKGVFIRRGEGTMASARPRGFVDEIFYENRVRVLEPGDLEKAYQRISGTRILNSKDLENNVKRLFEMAGEGITGRQPGDDGVMARVMLTDGARSVWVNVVRKEDLDFFRKKKNAGDKFLLGVSPVPQPAAPYGLTFSPYHFITGVTGQFVPEMMNATLKEIIVRQDHYRQEGLFSPPIWFITVKVTQIRSVKGARKDVRDW
ncbi:MAG: hypothetical protein ACOCWZ_05010 [Spirochaetota bacterium]